MLLVTPEQMREMDRRTIADVGLPGIVLMERAALGATEALLDFFELEDGARVGILCGGGNNAGDGFAMARMLAGLGFVPLIVLLRDFDRYEGDAALNLQICDRLELDIRDFSDLDETSFEQELEALRPCQVWIDALLGTGLDREVEGKYALAVDFLNQQDRVFAVDVPSGLDARTGQLLGACVEADATATFGQLKVGQVVYPGRARCGELYPVDIGIPARVVEDVGWTAELLTSERRVSARPPTFHKGDAGRVLLIGGQTGHTGAILMTARGALASGAGLITVGTDDDAVAHVAPAIHEAMAAPVLARRLEQSHVDTLEALLEKADVVAIGPGLGTHDGACEVLEMVLQSDADIVVDADGLNLMAMHHMQMKGLDYDRLVLTPHPGEMARLRGCEVSEVLDDPIGHAVELATAWSAIVVLKIASTIVAGPTGQLAINSTGNPGMATGGMGDALTGIIAAQLCEEIPRFEAVCNAVWAHGAAADLAARETGQRGLSVAATLDALPRVWKSVEL